MEVSILTSPNLFLIIFFYSNFLWSITNLVSISATISSENLTFSLLHFDPNGHDIVYEGDAYSSNNVIQLTINQRDMPLNGSVGRATYKDPLHLWENGQNNLADFTTQFSFSIDSQGSHSFGDGFAFFLAPNGSTLLPDSGGGNFGLLHSNQSDPENSKANFVAVEFDTYTNKWDPSGNHIGVDVGSVRSPSSTSWWWSDIENGGKVQACISYNSSSHNLTVFLFDEGDSEVPPRNSSIFIYNIDLREHLPEWVTIGFSGSTGSLSEIHMIRSWNFTSRLQVEDVTTISPASSPSSPVNSKKGINMKRFGIILVAVAFSFAMILGFAWFWLWMKRTSQRQSMRRDQEEDFEKETGPRKISYKDLLAATNKFSDENVLGQGGFGKVYRGFLNNKELDVAVKRITPNNPHQGSREFASEVKTISKLRHKNLVELIGWCCSKHQEYLIVYKFMPNKSLDFHLFQQNNLLTWDHRYKITVGLASALHYLQEEQDPYILHRDIKSSNILLDAEFNAKLGDFGLAKLVDHGKQSITTILRGTEGYVAPEYLESSVASKESDIYSFGIVCLEIACGKQALGEIREDGKKRLIKIAEWVWDYYRRENVIEAADPKLRHNFKREEMKQLLIVGLACAQPDFSLRPSIKQVIDMLNFKAPLPNLRLEYPGFSRSAVFLSAEMESLRPPSSIQSGDLQGQAPFSGKSLSSKASTASSTFSNLG